jgi:NADPH2 dehydrogenase
MSVIFNPLQIKNITLPNRIVMSPMCQYCATEEGEATDWHLVHYGARAAGQVGLVLLEATAVESRGRISPRDLGIWNNKQMNGIKRIVDFGHSQGSIVGIQLAHAGRKAELEEQIVAPSSIPFKDGSKVPLELSTDNIQEILQAFQSAACRAKETGVDVIEIHGAHGYLVHQFLSPLSNKRTDNYGGSLKNRFRILGEIIQSVRSEWPAEYPLFLRISAVEYSDEGLPLEDAIQICKWSKEFGVDLIDVSSGGNLPVPPPTIYPGYQVQYAEQIRKHAGIATGAVGLITSLEQAEEIVNNQSADLILLGRELLRNPYFMLTAAKTKQLEYKGPLQYERAYTSRHVGGIRI